MSLGMHPDSLQNLSIKMADCLPEIEVSNGQFLERWSSTLSLRKLDGALPQHGPIRRSLDGYIGENPVSTFVYETLSQQLRAGQKYNADPKTIRLITIPGYEDPKIVAAGIINEMESLPWEYSLVIKLNSTLGTFLSKNFKQYQINDSLRLVTPDESFMKEFVLPVVDRPFGFLDYLGHQQFDNWDRSSSYLQIHAKGFVGHFEETAPLLESVALLKTFCGIGIALRMFNVKYTYQFSPARTQFLIHRRDGAEWSFDHAHDLGPGLDVFHALVVNDLGGRLESESQQSSWVESQLKTISDLLKHPTKAEKIMLASQWLFDSYCGHNELLSFVQTVVAMEILLGEKAISDVLGLGELLRNRCAYLIGKSQQHRDEILDGFKKIYDVRSQIVHRGKSRLTEKERELFWDFRWMCSRVIQEEVELVEKDINKPPRKLIGKLAV